MATKKKTAEQAPDSQTVTAAPEQAVAEAEPREDEGGAHVEETTSEARETPVGAQEDVAAVVRAEAGPQLESLSVLADRHRVSSWQQAALLRFMDWTDDKLVSDAEYRAALENLKHRRIGGGRR